MNDAAGMVVFKSHNVRSPGTSMSSPLFRARFLQAAEGKHGRGWTCLADVLELGDSKLKKPPLFRWVGDVPTPSHELRHRGKNVDACVLGLGFEMQDSVSRHVSHAERVSNTNNKAPQPTMRPRFS